VLRIKSLVFAALGVTVAVVFFPVWFGVPVAVLFGGWELSLVAVGSAVAVDKEAGTLLFRSGFITRRVRLADVAAVLVEASKVSIARAGGGEISLYAWRKSTLDGWLRVPEIAGDIGHAAASAVALAQDAAGAAVGTAGVTAKGTVTGPAEDTAKGTVTGPAEDTANGTVRGSSRGTVRREVRLGTSAQTRSVRTRSTLASALLGGTGLVALAAAFLVRLHWHNPVMTALSVILALALGVSGLFYVLFTLWLLTRPPRPAGGRPSAA